MLYRRASRFLRRARASSLQRRRHSRCVDVIRLLWHFRIAVVHSLWSWNEFKGMGGSASGNDGARYHIRGA
jgi:hypothetical protein